VVASSYIVVRRDQTGWSRRWFDESRRSIFRCVRCTRRCNWLPLLALLLSRT